MKMSIMVTETSVPESLTNLIKGLGYSIVTSTGIDEIDQVGKQAGKILLIFNDAKFAYRFLKETRWNGFEFLPILYFNKIPAINADASRKLSEVGLFLTDSTKGDALAERISKFENQEDESLEIEFNIHKELGIKS